MKKTEEIKNKYLSETDTILLKDLWPVIENNRQRIAGSFYSYLESLDEFSVILDKYKRNKLEKSFEIWLRELFYDKYESSPSKKRKARGEVYNSMGIPMLSIVQALRYIRSSINYYISKDIGEREPGRAIRLNQAVNKALDTELLAISRCYYGNAGQVL